MTLSHAYATLSPSAIRVGNRLRTPDRDVTDLAESMKETGLIHPIHVRRREDGQCELVAGYHRLLAAKQLGWDTIPTYIFSGDALHAELLQIDENLIRKDLTAADRAKHLARRKELYEAIHPQAKQGATGRGGKKDAESASFVYDTSKKTGIPARTIAEDVQIGRNIAPDVMDAVADSPLADEKTALLNLSRLNESDQREVVGAMDLARQKVKDAADKKKADRETIKKIKAEIQARKKTKRPAGRLAYRVPRLPEPTEIIKRGAITLEGVAIMFDAVDASAVDAELRVQLIDSIRESIASIQRVVDKLQMGGGA